MKGAKHLSGDIIGDHRVAKGESWGAALKQQVRDSLGTVAHQARGAPVKT